MTKARLNSLQASKLLHYLFSFGMTNYGYTVTDYSRITAQRQRAKASVSMLVVKDKERLMANINNEWLTNDRLKLVNSGFELIVASSANEEVTNVIRRIANPEAKWAA